MITKIAIPIFDKANRVWDRDSRLYGKEVSK
jgi:hypothetical protein